MPCLTPMRRRWAAHTRLSPPPRLPPGITRFPSKLAVGCAPAPSGYLVKFAAAGDPSGYLAQRVGADVHWKAQDAVVQTGTHGAAAAAARRCGASCPKVLFLQAARLLLHAPRCLPKETRSI